MGVLYAKDDDAALDAAMERALTEGPLTVIRPGRPSMVVLSADEYRKLGGEPAPASQEPSLVECLLQHPFGAGEGVDLDALIGDRHVTSTRPSVDFDS